MNLYIFFIVLSHSFIGTIFFFAVPYYEENRLDAARRDNKELNIFFEAPYSTKGNSGNQDSELANSSKWCTLWTNPHIRTKYFILSYAHNYPLIDEEAESSWTEKKCAACILQVNQKNFWHKLSKICSKLQSRDIAPIAMNSRCILQSFYLMKSRGGRTF